MDKIFVILGAFYKKINMLLEFSIKPPYISLQT